MFFLVLMCAVAFGYFFGVRERALLRTHMEEQGKSIVNSIGRFFEHGILYSDQFFLQRIAERIIEDEDILFCSVFDKDGKQLIHVAKKEPLSEPDLVNQITQPIRSNEKRYSSRHPRRDRYWHFIHLDHDPDSSPAD